MRKMFLVTALIVLSALSSSYADDPEDGVSVPPEQADPANTTSTEEIDERRGKGADIYWQKGENLPYRDIARYCDGDPECIAGYYEEQNTRWDLFGY